MNTPLEPGADHFIDRVGLLFERRGGPGMAGRILAFLLICRDPVQSSSAIAKAMQTSSGTVSINTRLLEQMGLIERTSVRGRRGAFFRARRGAWGTLFRSQIEDAHDMREVFEQGLSSLVDPTEDQRERMGEVLDFYAFLEEELPAIVERWLARRSR